MALAAVNRVHAQRLGNAGAHRSLGRRLVEHDLPTGKLRPEPAQRQVRIGVGGRRVAPPVAGRPRIGTRRLRPVVQRAGVVDPGERAAARADGQHLDAGEADRIAELDVPVLGDARFTAEDQRDVAARAAHVEADGVLVAAKHGDVAACDGAGGDAGAGEAARELPGGRRSHDAPAGMEHQQVALVAALLQRVVHPRHIAADNGAQDCVDHRGGEALVLEDFGQGLG